MCGKDVLRRVFFIVVCLGFSGDNGCGVGVRDARVVVVVG